MKCFALLIHSYLWCTVLVQSTKGTVNLSLNDASFHTAIHSVNSYTDFRTSNAVTIIHSTKDSLVLHWMFAILLTWHQSSTVLLQKYQLYSSLCHYITTIKQNRVSTKMHKTFPPVTHLDWIQNFVKFDAMVAKHCLVARWLFLEFNDQHLHNIYIQRYNRNCFL
jgi:hypothetical protein